MDNFCDNSTRRTLSYLGSAKCFRFSRKRGETTVTPDDKYFVDYTLSTKCSSASDSGRTLVKETLRSDGRRPSTGIAQSSARARARVAMNRRSLGSTSRAVG